MRHKLGESPPCTRQHGSKQCKHLPATRSVGIQTVPTFWPAGATQHNSQAVPALLSARGCVAFPALVPDGTLFQLECEHMGVTCVIPCLPGYKVWGLRVGLNVYGACTYTVEWHHILQIALSSDWDLPGMSIVSATSAWHWPDDITDFHGQCGHLLHSGSDPYMCMHVEGSRPRPAESPEPRPSTRVLH